MSYIFKDEIIKGYVPHDFNIGGGDYIDFRYCLDCGRIQDVFHYQLIFSKNKYKKSKEDHK